MIPFARGPARSRIFDEIVQEANCLVKSGHQELVLTGVNLGTYSYENYAFMDILKALEGIEKLKRIRVSSIEPTTIPDDFICMMRDSVF